MNATETCEDRDYRCCELDSTPAEERQGDEWYVRHVREFWAQIDLGTEKRLPDRFCVGCGQISETTLEERVHASMCEVPRYRPWACWACATENWRTDTCRCCGWTRPEDR